MFTFEVNGKEYKVKFGYGVLCKTDIMDEISKSDDNTSIRKTLDMSAELLLAGLQKYHKDEFGYTTQKEKEEKKEAVYNLLDEYEDESTDENPQDVFTLSRSINEELMNVGFLKKAMEAVDQEEAEKLPKAPQDHKKKSK